MVAVGEVVRVLNRWWSPGLAASWDNVGLLVGDGQKKVGKTLFCLTVTRGVVEEAINAGAGLIVSHHPVLFSATKRLTADTVQGGILLGLISHHIAVYSPHTAHDSALGGINQQIAMALGLTGVCPLKPLCRDKLFKVVAFVPEEHREHLLQAAFAAGAGTIGDYRECAFRTQGFGSFHPGVEASPFIGKVGTRETVQEDRVEFVCPGRNLAQVIDDLKIAHPYEEPALDVYPLETVGGDEGEGRIGQLSEPLTQAELARRCGKLFGCSQVQWVGPPEKTIRRVAIGCGAAGSFAPLAKKMGADVFITGEMRYHEELEAYQTDLGVILLGHYGSEKFAMAAMAERMKQAIPDLQVQVSREDDLERHFLFLEPASG